MEGDRANSGLRGHWDRMLPLAALNSAADKRRGRALWRYLDPPDRLLSAQAKEVNSPCGKVRWVGRGLEAGG